MSDSSNAPKDIHIQNEPAAGAEPAHVSVVIDGEKKYVVRTGDLENIGAQLRGRKSFSFFNSIILPAAVVLVTTLIAQAFQYISWRNATRLSESSERAQAAKDAYLRASNAMSERYYATKLYLDAVRDLNRKKGEDMLFQLDTELNQQSFKDFYAQIKKWSTSYDQISGDLDFKLDRPVLWHSERTTVRDFDGRNHNNDKLLCNGLLPDEFKRLHLNVDSLKVQFAAINYCYSQLLVPFEYEREKAIADKNYPISESVRKDVNQANEDIRSLANEFRCFGQHRLAYFDEQRRKSIFNLRRWLRERISALFVKPADAKHAALNAAREECNFNKAAMSKGHSAS